VTEPAPAVGGESRRAAALVVAAGVAPTHVGRKVVDKL